MPVMLVEHGVFCFRFAGRSFDLPPITAAEAKLGYAEGRCSPTLLYRNLGLEDNDGFVTSEPPLELLCQGS